MIVKRRLMFVIGLGGLLISLIMPGSCTSRFPSPLKLEGTSGKLTDTRGAQVGGVLGHALEISKEGRLSQFINSPESEAILLFTHGKQSPHGGGWRGEHGGKWLIAASKAAYRTNDENLKNNVIAVADFLISLQSDNGYIGSYVDSIRFYYPPEIVGMRTWDVWISAYIMKGFINIYEQWGDEKYLDATKKIANLLMETFMDGETSLANTGYYGGLAPNGVIESFVDLYNVTKGPKYLEFAAYCVNDLEKRPGTEIVTRALNKLDVAQIDGGKMYEMIRVFIGFAKLYQATNNDTLLHVVNYAWEEIFNRHLTPSGTPWGGIHLPNKECFNIGYMFSPYGYSETCAVMEWFRFTKEMYKITGDLKYVNELEKTAYNGILAAQFPDGVTWTYHTRPNGERTSCGPFACCSSSGPIVLEEIPEVIYTLKDDGIAVNIFTESQHEIALGDNPITIRQETDYPWDGRVQITISREGNELVPLYIRIPEWAKDSEISFNEKTIHSDGNEYIKIEFAQEEAVISLNMPIEWQVGTITNDYNYKGYYLYGTEAFFYLKRGPVVYAMDLKDELDHPVEDRFNPDQVIAGLMSIEEDTEIPLFRLEDYGINFSPYFMADGRTDGNFRSTWLRTKSNGVH